MRCHKCKANKLHREFPHKALTENCEHAPLHCLRCTTEFVEKNQQCSVCKEPVAIVNPNYQECVYELKRMFPDAEALQAAPCITNDETIKVSSMGGEEVAIKFKPNMTVLELKKKIQENFKIKPEEQRLLYWEKQLETYNYATLHDYNVQSSSTINLVVVLYKIPESFDEVRFDLSWDFPVEDSGPVKRYLDASILLYNGNTFKEVLDWKHKNSKRFKAVRHSGDSYADNTKLRGRQAIKVKIKDLPLQIDKMFFTLSAFTGPDEEPEKISKYPNVRLHFFDARDPDNQLCDDSLTQAADSEAVIMCSMCKTAEGKWQVLSLKHMCNGNAENYTPIQDTIQELIKNGMS